MAIQSLNSSFYADPAGLTALKREASAQTPEALRETAKQFESLFTTMMLKSMREATPEDSLFGSDQQDFYQDMFDQQLSAQLSKGKGLGLADVLVRQLMQGIGGAGEAGAETGVVQPGAGMPGITPAAAEPASVRQWPPRSREEFVQAILPAAREAGKRIGVDAETIVAHAALETGWGSRLPTGADGKTSFNLFGIKAGQSWTGGAATADTAEFENGRMQSVQAKFRAYDSPEHSVRDYASFLSGNPRYAAALGTGSDSAAFGNALQKAGYATDPDYARKLQAVASGLKSRDVLPITATGA